ncbi:hypothetical protein ACQKWADRAFT_91105 [Trichoderma austrokoningii]
MPSVCLLWLVAITKMLYCMLGTALILFTGNGLSSAARIKSLARFHLELTVRTPPQAGKDCVRDRGPLILVPGSSEYSTIKCLSSRPSKQQKSGRGRERLLLAERSWPLSWPLLKPGRFVAARYELLHAGCSVRAQLLWHRWQWIISNGITGQRRLYWYEYEPRCLGVDIYMWLHMLSNTRAAINGFPRRALTCSRRRP